MSSAPPEKPRGSCLSLILAGGTAVVIFGGLMIVTLNWIGAAMGIVVGLFGIIALHYLVWGWWLKSVLERDEPPDAEEPPNSDWRNDPPRR